MNTNLERLQAHYADRTRLDVFEFSGLGVEQGETVRVKEVDGRPDVREMYWDGTQLVDSQLEITREFWTLPRTLGVVLIVLGVVVGLSIAGKKWAAARQ
jgi:hypothetical protein